MAADWTRDVGDTYPIEATLLRDGVPLDLRGATMVQCRLTVRRLRAATIVDASSGAVSLPLTDADVADPGTIGIQWVVTWPSGVQTYPAGRAMTLAIVQGLK